MKRLRSWLCVPCLASSMLLSAADDSDFEYVSERFADLQVLRYQVPGFEELSLQEKELLYYLYEAALAGRDIIWDQHCKYNLAVRRTLENIVNSYEGERDGQQWEAFMVYAKRVWFSNGIHHHYSTVKMLPDFSVDYFGSLLQGSDINGFPMQEGQSLQDLHEELTQVIFDPDFLAKGVNKTAGIDVVAQSANNFYEGVSAEEVAAYYLDKKSSDKDPSWGLNSKLVRVGDELVERVWKVDGMYGEALENVAYWLERACLVAQNEAQRDALEKLVVYLRSGDLGDFDDYSIAWVKDVDSSVDVINGFIEVYGDALGKRGAYESVVSVRDPIASKRIEAIGEQAQWFEDHSPIQEEHKKEEVRGISARVINVVMESGDASPATPIGINLPNSEWIREEHGSKSVNLGNIVHAYGEASKSSGILDEFYLDDLVIERLRADKGLSSHLHTDMHEVIGHASGKLMPGVGSFSETLGAYSSTLEEARADLVGLYYIHDEKLVDMGLMPSLDTGKAGYDRYITNGLMLQLRRIKLGEDIEEDHMRNRQMLCNWALEMGADDNVIERVSVDGKTYFVINDYERMREIWGLQLREIQRIKSEGDYEAGRALVEGYGVKVDPELHEEVYERFASLDLAPYSGFINPELRPIYKGRQLVDVEIYYPTDFAEQMLDYAKHYSFLPTYN